MFQKKGSLGQFPRSSRAVPTQLPGNCVGTAQELRENYLGPTRDLLGTDLGPTWDLLGTYLGPTWGLLGTYLALPSRSQSWSQDGPTVFWDPRNPRAVPWELRAVPWELRGNRRNLTKMLQIDAENVSE